MKSIFKKHTISKTESNTKNKYSDDEGDRTGDGNAEDDDDIENKGGDDDICGGDTSNNSGDEDKSNEGGDTNDDGAVNGGDNGDDDDNGDEVDGSNRDVAISNVNFGEDKNKKGYVQIGGVDSYYDDGVDNLGGVDINGEDDAYCDDGDTKLDCSNDICDVSRIFWYTVVTRSLVMQSTLLFILNSGDVNWCAFNGNIS